MAFRIDRSPQFPVCERNQIRAVLFDCDGVLVDSRETYRRAYEMVLGEAGASVTPREIYLREGQPTAQLLAALLTRCGITITDADILEMVERRRNYDTALGGREFFPEICDLLVQLRRLAYKVVMVTGSSRRSIDMLLTPERKRWFDLVITADDVRRPKPDPQPFTLAAGRLGVAPGDCLVVENAPFGIRAAREAGCRTIGICTTLEAADLEGADWIVQDHQELVTLLGS
jgi:beta-phosphoglucomutase